MAANPTLKSTIHFQLLPFDSDKVDKRTPVLEIYRSAHNRVLSRDGGYGWRLLGANGEKLCGAFDGDGFSSARGAWISATRSATYLAGTLTIPLANITGTPPNGADLMLVHPERGAVLRIRRLLVE